MREIVLDTETTGLNVKEGDRITEIGCVEVFDKKLTGRTYHTYVNPEREVSFGATEISGLTYKFLRNYGTFDKVAEGFLEFIGGDKIIIHNAPFDVEFLNFELNRIGRGALENSIVDTLVMAKQKFPGSPASLDAICSRFSIDKSSRVKHGALIDAELLAQVYIIMSVETTQKDIFHRKTLGTDLVKDFNGYTYENIIPDRKFSLSLEELELHNKLINKIKAPLWEQHILEMD